MNGVEDITGREDKRKFLGELSEFSRAPILDIKFRFIKKSFQVGAELAQSRKRIFDFFKVDQDFFAQSFYPSFFARKSFSNFPPRMC